MDSFLVTLVVIAIAGLSNWLQQRAKAREEPPRTPRLPPRPVPPRTPLPTGKPPHPRTGAPSLPSPLERELRRLLGEELVPEPTPPPPVSPPPIHHAPGVPPATRPVAGPEPVPEPQVVSGAGRLHESAAAYSHAQQLHGIVAERIHQADPVAGRPRLKATGIQAARGRAYPGLAALRKDSQAARQAFVASLVFGAPKGLE